MSSAESGLSIAGWSLWGGAADRMQFFCCFFYFGGGGGGEAFMSMACAAYRLAGWCGYLCVETWHRF